MTARPNLVLIMSDEHNRACAGCYGHPFVRTPNLDRLARQGTRFTDAYCNSPICVPSRAAFATGQYVHRTGHWDNAFPYTGTPESWHHRLRDAGGEVVSIGKLHFRGGDDNGFSEEILPLHVVDGVGDLKGLLRRPMAAKKGNEQMAKGAGRGDSEYSRYDRAICDAVKDWLRARQADGTPFALFVSFVMPHFPLVAPGPFYDLYEDMDLATLRHGLDAPAPDHPALAQLRGYMAYDDHFDDERRAVALRAYYGMVSAIDAMVGEILEVLEETGQGGDTFVAYTSDHGDNLGNRGLWGKSVMYEDSAGVPVILRGPGVPEGHVCRTPVSLMDMHPTALDLWGLPPDAALPGASLVQLANAPDAPERPVFAEYHAAGAPTGMFMYREGRFKLVEYPGERPQLFDLAEDPGERRDLAADPSAQDALARLRAGLARICDIEEVPARASADQAEAIARHGGREAILRGVDIPHTPAPV